MGRTVGLRRKKKKAKKKMSFRPLTLLFSFSAPLSMLRIDDDEEEAARERRRRARQERLKGLESEEPSSQPDNAVMTNSGGDDDDQALQERMAKREERRQRRMKEALERQKQLDPTSADGGDGVSQEKNSTEEERTSWRTRRYRDTVEEEEKTESSSSRREEKEQEEPREEEEEPAPEEEEEEEEEEEQESKSVLLDDIEEDFEVSEMQQSEDNEVSHMRPDQVSRGNLSPCSRVCLSRGSVRSPEASAGDEQDDDARLEAERKLEELKRRRDDAESEEFERMRQKQQEAEAELEELKRKREERRKVLEEEERQRKQEEAERRAREEVIFLLRGLPSFFFPSLFFGIVTCACLCSSVKASHSPVVSKIDNRLEQYTSAIKESRSPRSTVLDLPMVTDVRNIKSMWEKGNVFSSPGGGGSTFKEAAVIKTGVAGRINDWLNKTPESGKTSGGRPTVGLCQEMVDIFSTAQSVQVVLLPECAYKQKCPKTTCSKKKRKREAYPNHTGCGLK
uniref:Caldesmon 1b n=1 Tax=Fundulus heteroclitus TaxID=8078 RepID=A0A3Q2QI48_FUNHE